MRPRIARITRMGQNFISICVLRASRGSSAGRVVLVRRPGTTSTAARARYPKRSSGEPHRARFPNPEPPPRQAGYKLGELFQATGRHPPTGRQGRCSADRRSGIAPMSAPNARIACADRSVFARRTIHRAGAGIGFSLSSVHVGQENQPRGRKSMPPCYLGSRI